MTKIKNIEYNNNYVEMEVENNYVYKFPLNNEYVKSLVIKAINENKNIDKDIKFYEKCADISIYPIWIALAFVIYSLVTNFILLDLVLIACGAMTAVSLTSTTVFKLVSKKLKSKANNNEHFAKLYEYAITGKKQEEKLKNKANNNQYSNEKNKVTQNYQTKKVDNNYYHLNKNQIIQDEVEHTRKR